MLRGGLFFAAAAVGFGAADSRIVLRDRWTVGPSRDQAPHITSVPSTVFSTLIADRTFPDPYFGMNLRKAVGVNYAIGTMFANQPMPPDSPFAHSWWYRTNFDLPAKFAGQSVRLGFDGINYRANLYLNGKLIAGKDKFAGAWRLFEFDVTEVARPRATNTLEVEVFAPEPGDLAITFVDWNPMPPDKMMGLWRDVWVEATGPVVIRYPFVTTKLNGSDATLTVRAELSNLSGRPLEVVWKGSVEARKFEQAVRLEPHQTVTVHAPLTIKNPRLWWPVHAGDQNLYVLETSVEIAGKTSDSAHQEFGIREVTSELTAEGHRMFRVNGKPILIRGAGYTFDLMLRSTPERQQAELNYVRDMNLNAIRFEGKLEDERFLGMTDRMGILVLAGWCCCDHWEKWNNWDSEDENIAAESLRDQLRRLARHPSVFDWFYGSDNPPPPKIESLYLDVIKEVEWPNPFQSSATARKTPAGDTGLKMSGPYEYVAPSYWLTDTKLGGAHGFNTETSPGPSPPPIESLRRMLPEDKLWPINPEWDYHAGGGTFKNIKIFTDALDRRYGESHSAEEFARKSQMMAYEGHRAMFEAYGRNKYTSTGVIQWMLNNAWPSLIWHLYDWYLRPGGSYFGAKKANEPLHVQYSYDDRSIAVVNSFNRGFAGLKVAAAAYNLDMTRKWQQEAAVEVAADGVVRAFTVPELPGLSTTWFLHLRLSDRTGATVSENFYWLSTVPEAVEWEKSTYYHTPTRTFADYTALATLPQIELKATSTSRVGSTTVRITNPGKSLAFGVRLKVVRDTDREEVLPVLWEDNYIALLPGESRTLKAAYAAKDLGTAHPLVLVEGWNVR